MEPTRNKYGEAFKLRPVDIWRHLDDRQKMLLILVFQLNQEAERCEQERLASGAPNRACDEWRWFPMSTAGGEGLSLLQIHLDRMGITQPDAIDGFRTLETIGLLRCAQDRWSADDRLFVRILLLGMRVVNAGIDYSTPNN